MTEIKEIISLLLAPVIMISACGLLCLAYYNRLAALVGRIRAFNKELLDALAPVASSNAANAPRLRERASMLEDQVKQIMRRARLIRNALLCLLTCILLMLLCSLAMGLCPLWVIWGWVALTAFVIGIIFAIIAMVLAAVELTHALQPAALEFIRIEHVPEE